MDLQRAFDTVDHQILLGKLDQYHICGISNDWFKLYQSNCSHYVSINGYESSLAAINCGVHQGFVLGPLTIFIIYKQPKSSNKILQSSSFC